MQLVITEKPSVAQAVARVIGADERKDGYMEGNGYIVSWCIGHLVELAQPDARCTMKQCNRSPPYIRLFFHLRRSHGQSTVPRSAFLLSLTP